MNLCKNDWSWGLFTDSWQSTMQFIVLCCHGLFAEHAYVTYFMFIYYVHSYENSRFITLLILLGGCQITTMILLCSGKLKRERRVPTSTKQWTSEYPSLSNRWICRPPSWFRRNLGTPTSKHHWLIGTRVSMGVLMRVLQERHISWKQNKWSLVKNVFFETNHLPTKNATLRGASLTKQKNHLPFSWMWVGKTRVDRQALTKGTNSLSKKSKPLQVFHFCCLNKSRCFFVGGAM